MILKILLLHIQQHDRYCKTLILDMLLLNNILYIYIYFFYAYFLWINFMHKNTFYGKPSWTRKSYQIKVHPHNHNIYLRVFFNILCSQPPDTSKRISESCHCDHSKVFISMLDVVFVNISPRWSRNFPDDCLHSPLFIVRLISL